MSGEVGKRGGGVRKMMNSENLEREREKKKRKRVFTFFGFWQQTGLDLYKIAAAPISPRVTDRAVKILKPLGRNQESARAD